MKIDEIKELIRNKQYSQALAACDVLLAADSSTVAEVSRLRSRVYTAQGAYRAGVREIERIIEAGQATIGDYHSAAFWSLYDQNYATARDWLYTVVDLGRHEDDPWFESSAQFYLAYTNMMLGDLKKAEEFLGNLRAQGTDAHVPIPNVGSYTRIELLEEIKRRSLE
jgi:hypothetical protein